MSIVLQPRIQRLLSIPEEKENFPIFKEKALNLIIWNLFSQALPSIKENKEIVVAGTVYKDGKGDWHALVNMCHHLKKKFPTYSISLVAAATLVHKDKLFAPKVQSVDITYDPVLFGEAITNKIKKADFIIKGPAAQDGGRLYDLFPEKVKKNSMIIHEYDFSSPRMIPTEEVPNEEVMGLGLQSIGIFTKNSKMYSFQDIQNLHLLNLFFKKSSFTQMDIDNYLSKNELYFAYFSEMKMKYINEVLALSKSNTKSIDFVLILKNDNMIEEGVTSRLNSEGISSIKIIKCTPESTVEKIIKFNVDGKELRIIVPQALSTKDFKVLTQISSPVVGCTGDNSIAQVLSYGKIPFYETSSHKENFYTELLNVVDFKFGKDSVIYQYIHHVPRKKMDISESEYNQLIIQAKELGGFIRQNHSFNEILKGIVNEGLLRASDIEYQNSIKKLREDFLESKISIEEFEKNLRNELEQRKLL
jgi:hypothetical protein